MSILEAYSDLVQNTHLERTEEQKLESQVGFPRFWIASVTAHTHTHTPVYSDIHYDNILAGNTFFYQVCAIPSAKPNMHMQSNRYCDYYMRKNTYGERAGLRQNRSTSKHPASTKTHKPQVTGKPNYRIISQNSA